MNLNDEEQWLTDFIRVPLVEEIRERVKNFALLWNLFETFVCNRTAKPLTIDQGIEVIHGYSPITINFVDQYRIYFTARYIDPQGQTNNRYSNLKFRPSDREADVLNMLTGKTIDPKEILKALLYIVLRLRNNLFHGNKNVAQLNGQVDNFTNANNLLIDILALLRQHNQVNQYNFPAQPVPKKNWGQKMLDWLRNFS